MLAASAGAIALLIILGTSFLVLRESQTEDPVTTLDLDLAFPPPRRYVNVTTEDFERYPLLEQVYSKLHALNASGVSILLYQRDMGPARSMISDLRSRFDPPLEGPSEEIVAFVYEGRFYVLGIPPPHE